MNPLTNVKNITKLNDTEVRLGVKHESSWHQMYKDSAWVFIGGLNYELTEGDVICVFSQYGEVTNVNLIRDKKSGKSKGFCFLCYENQKSTVLAVDNFNGIKLASRIIRVDHVAGYRPPEITDDLDEETSKLYSEGCAPRPATSEPLKSRKDTSDDHNNSSNSKTTGKQSSSRDESRISDDQKKVKDIKLRIIKEKSREERHMDRKMSQTESKQRDRDRKEKRRRSRSR